MKKIIYFGYPFSFTHIAAMRRFGKGCEYISQPTIAEVFAQLKEVPNVTAVVPIENTGGGMVYDTVDELLRDDFLGSGLKIREQLSFSIVLNLLARTKLDLDKVKKIYSHKFAHTACRRWVKKHLPSAEVVDVVSTSEAAKRAYQQMNSCAIGSKEAAKYYGLKILKHNIAKGDVKHDITKFFVIETGKRILQEKDVRTSLAFSLAHKVGTLARALGVLARNQINLTRIISRPSDKGAWEYKFLIEFKGSTHSEKVRKALKRLKKYTLTLNDLGSYPTREV